MVKVSLNSHLYLVSEALKRHTEEVKEKREKIEQKIVKQRRQLNRQLTPNT